MENENDPWRCVKSEHDGKPVFIRARERLRDLVNPERNSRLLRAGWPCQSRMRWHGERQYRHGAIGCVAV
jgi:hypothetical protein